MLRICDIVNKLTSFITFIATLIFNENIQMQEIKRRRQTNNNSYLHRIHMKIVFKVHIYFGSIDNFK